MYLDVLIMNTFYVIVKYINNQYEVVVCHPWDAVVNYTYSLKSAVHVKLFSDYDDAVIYSRYVSRLTRTYLNALDIAEQYKQQIDDL